MTTAFIPGPDAKRCLDCACIHNSAGSCPACGSAASWPEDAWLERKQTKLMVRHIADVTEIWRESE